MQKPAAFHDCGPGWRRQKKRFLPQRTETAAQERRLAQQVHFGIPLGNLPDRLCRNAEGQPSCGNVVRDHAACAHDRALSYGHAVDDGNIGRQPDVVFNMNFSRELRRGHVAVRIGHAYALIRNEGMVGTEKADVGSEHHIVADDDFPVVKDEQIEVRKKVVADERVAAVIKLDGPLKVIIPADAPYEFLYERQPIRIIFIHGVELPAQLVRHMLDVLEFPTSRIKKPSCKNLFFFRHSRLFSGMLQKKRRPGLTTLPPHAAASAEKRHERAQGSAEKGKPHKAVEAS